MKAVVYNKYGPPDVLLVENVEKPVPLDNELLIKVRAAEVTKADCEMRSFNFQVKWFWLPLRLASGLFKPKRKILGIYFAGEIESVGKGVTRFKAGDRVFGTAGLRMGAHGEYVRIPDRYTLAAKPENVTFAEAAAVPLGGLNAHHFLRKANIQKGERVLVNGAGGSIGIFGVQIAKSMGAEVTAVDSAIKEEVLRKVGADHFCDYSKEDFTQSGQTYDVIFSMVANTSYSACVRALNPRGRYLITNPRLADMLRALLTTMFTQKTAIFAFAKETEEELIALKKMLEAGIIKPVVDKVYSFEQADEAHQKVETEQRLGTIVISSER
jgi:NADPH:quinone reductase-like Zn-dependent oxidoreductase